MSSLFNTQIKDTYQGLLKLDDSSTGITQNLQAIQDGLGNNTGLRIATGKLEAQNITSFIPLKAQYYGAGLSGANAAQYSSGIQGTIIAVPFQDGGEYSYSAITFNTVSATSTSDTVEFALYTPQMINPFGLFPHTPIVSGITADTTTTGSKTYVFPSPISFSGYGGGLYFLVYKISNGGVQPTWRPSSYSGGLTISTQSQQIYGLAQQFTTTVFSSQTTRLNNSQVNMMSFSGLTTFDNPYSNTINTLQSTSTTVSGNGAGFILHTVDA
jgi:hypothetical protein